MPFRLVSEVVAQGSFSELADLEDLDQLYQEGDIGELRLFLRGDAPLAEVEDSLTELEDQLWERGALPWPGADTIVFLDWPNRTVVLRFQQGVPFLLVLAAVLLALAGVAKGISLVADALRAAGVPVPQRVDTIADAVALFAAIALGVIILKSFAPFIPLAPLVAGGILVFALLEPGLAWQALKFVFKTVGTVIEKVFTSSLLGKVLVVGALAVGTVVVVSKVAPPMRVAAKAAGRWTGRG